MQGIGENDVPRETIRIRFGKAGAHPHAVSFASQMWAARPHLGSIFEKLLHRKTFRLPAAHILQPLSSYKLEHSAAATSKFQVARSTIPVGFRAVRL